MALHCSASVGMDLGGSFISTYVSHARTDGVNSQNWTDLTEATATKNAVLEYNWIGAAWFAPPSMPDWWKYSAYQCFISQGFRIPQLDRLMSMFVGDAETIDGVTGAKMELQIPDVVGLKDTYQVTTDDMNGQPGWTGPYPYYPPGGGDPLGYTWTKAQTGIPLSTFALQLCLVGYKEHTVDGETKAFPEFLGGGGGAIPLTSSAITQVVDCAALVKTYLLNRARYIGFGLCLIPAEMTFEDFFGGFNTPEEALLKVEEAFHVFEGVAFLGWSAVVDGVQHAVFAGTDTCARVQWGTPVIGNLVVGFDMAKFDPPAGGLMHEEFPTMPT